MRGVILFFGFLVAVVLSAWSQNSPSGSISVKYAIDGKAASCALFDVHLVLDGETITPKRKGQQFEVPDKFTRPSSAWTDSQRVDISITCNEHTFVFPGLHPGFLSEGSWEFGIVRPPYWIERFIRGTGQFEKEHGLATHFEGEPGVIVSVSHPDIPTEFADALRKEQPSASGERARDIAYALAVFNIDYKRNRDYLLSLLNSCLSRSESPADDECDGKLLDFVTNLYWRGDDALLAPLLGMADVKKYVVLEIGTFYGDLLDRRQTVFLQALSLLSEDKQKLVCELASEDDLRPNSPKFVRVATHLRETVGDEARRCLKAVQVELSK